MILEQPMMEVMDQSYEQWRQHPVTSLLIKALLKHKERYTNELMGNANNFTIESEQLRSACMCLKTTDTILKVVMDPKLLLTATSNNQIKQ